MSTFTALLLIWISRYGSVVCLRKHSVVDDSGCEITPPAVLLDGTDRSELVLISSAVLFIFILG